MLRINIRLRLRGRFLWVPIVAGWLWALARLLAPCILRGLSAHCGAFSGWCQHYAGDHILPVLRSKNDVVIRSAVEQGGDHLPWISGAKAHRNPFVRRRSIDGCSRCSANSIQHVAQIGVRRINC